MVAPSFQEMTVMSSTYTKNGKLYIDVKNEKTGTIRSVRWYSEKEYAKAYGNKSKGEAKVIIPKGTKIFHKRAAAAIVEVSNTNPRTIKALVAADPRIAKVFLWEAYGASLEEKKEKKQ